MLRFEVIGNLISDFFESFELLLGQGMLHVGTGGSLMGQDRDYMAGEEERSIQILQWVPAIFTICGSASSCNNLMVDISAPWLWRHSHTRASCFEVMPAVIVYPGLRSSKYTRPLVFQHTLIITLSLWMSGFGVSPLTFPGGIVDINSFSSLITIESQKPDFFDYKSRNPAKETLVALLASLGSWGNQRPQRLDFPMACKCLLDSVLLAARLLLSKNFLGLLHMSYDSGVTTPISKWAKNRELIPVLSVKALVKTLVIRWLIYLKENKILMQIIFTPHERDSIPQLIILVFN